MALDFINTYFPDVADVSQEALLSARERLDIILKKKYPDLDSRPNSVFGDLALSPYAYLVAAHEIAMDRFLSDLDLEQVANGIVYNCDFVRKYIQNFATTDQETLKSSGVIRLVFCADDSYTIDRRARFLFTTGNEFTLRLPNAGSLFVLPVGSIPTAYTNEYALKQISETNYAIDIGVVGTMTTQVSAGDEGTTDYPITDMTNIIAVTNFDFGLPAESLATLAAKTRETFYSATLTTRSGTNNYLSREFPDLTATSPLLPGDTGAVRAAVNALGVANGKIDVCVQSKNFGTTVSQTIKLVYSTSGASGPAYYGKLDLIEVPQIFESIQYAGDTTILLGDKGSTGDIVVLGQSTNFSKAPLLTSAYSDYEDYWIRIVAPSTAGFDFDPLSDGATGDQYNYFTINYRADPLVKVVSDTLASSDLTPVGVDVLVKGYVPIYINSLLITYTKKAGVRVALDTAKTEIYNYFRTLGYNNIYAASKIYDAMYYAGADDVVSITVNSNVQWDFADKILPASVTADPSTQVGFDAAYAASLSLPADVPNSLSATAAFDPTTYGVLEMRNRGYYLPIDNILFSEVIY
jgi:hypothetical protein